MFDIMNAVMTEAINVARNATPFAMVGGSVANTITAVPKMKIDMVKKRSPHVRSNFIDIFNSGPPSIDGLNIRYFKLCFL